MKQVILVVILCIATTSISQTPERYYQDGKAGYKLNNQILIEPIYDCGSDYYEGFALVCQNGKFGFLDEKGKQLGFMEFDHAGVFSQGLAKVKKNGKYGFINREGKVVIDYQYDYVTDFSEGVAGAQLNGKWAILSIDGRLITDWMYDFIMPASEGKIGTKKDNSWGFLDTNGQISLEFNYTFVQSFTKGVAIVGIKDEDGVEQWKIDSKGALLGKIESEEEKRERENKVKH